MPTENERFHLEETEVNWTPLEYAYDGDGDGDGDGTGDGDGDGDGDGKGKGGGDDKDPPKFSLNEVLAHEAHKTVITDWAERELVKPLKDKNAEVLGKLVKYKFKPEGSDDEEYLDPIEAASAVKQVRSGKSSTTQEEIDRAVNAANDRSNAIVEGLKARVTELEDSNKTGNARRHNLMIDHNLGDSLIASGIKPGKKHLHERYLKEFIQVTDDGGKESIIIMDPDGKPRYGSQGLMSMGEFVNEYKNREGVAEDWLPTSGGGSGTLPGASGNRGGASVVDQAMDPTDRLKVFRRSVA